ncbi:ComEC/Rec2 family competence protein [Halalkalibacter kiskunsagensis]|uniref:ComEC/Rec2 family competence protein n=1 Tax=Halalkalibacter kiskunsagensis TaxID=1548599 RepID=A0ABV6KGK2_9BACI
MSYRLFVNIRIFLLLIFLFVGMYPMVTFIKAESTSMAIEVETDPSRTAELFDETKHMGMLQIRYLDLKADTKSGDAILLQSPDGEAMLIDAGMVATGQELDNYLNQLNIEKLDYAVATHPHHDHIGGYHTLFHSKQIGVLLMPDLPHTTQTYKTFIDLSNKKKIKTQYVQANDTFMLGDEVEVEIVSPSFTALGKARNKRNLSTAEVNNLSLVIKVTYRNNTFLFTGDIYKKQEKELIKQTKDKLDVDLLHAPHHGDSTSSSQAFINAVSPKYTMISANILQSIRVYNRYQKSGSEVIATSRAENVLILSDGESITIMTEKGGH